MAEMRTYQRAQAVVFRKTNERFGGLSNMAPGYPLEINGTRIHTAEALYQASRFPHLPDVQHLIIRQISPMTAKMRSKPFRKDSRPDWERVRVPIMKWCLRVKLAQNWENFGQLLLETDTLPIVEDSRKDEYWGAKASEDGTLHGNNVLGRLLMELREKLKRDPSTLFEVQPLPVDDFLLFGLTIPPIAALARKHLIVQPQAKKILPPAQASFLDSDHR
ncbi:NADAR family protein [Mesorhizobium opportunistum]|uniref:NADAR family protein n=1 Tax=Mesorhizobium opportunistum TaxID=593909 RepID=A0ABV1YHW0_9HYPH|nr:NADAR family protein [Mesorhizobium sp.]TIN96521.1 MAG: NADAR family protein [Mesorhizobium sp.]TJU98196.1 MAG: NADAR family protein [Mesorhizobium sp.]TJV15990.1 MAG: NADAR family protein [Mesorhizobium sp.]